MIRFEDIQFQIHRPEPLIEDYDEEDGSEKTVQPRNAFILFPNGIVLSIQQTQYCNCRFPDAENKEGTFEIALMMPLGESKPDEELMGELTGKGRADGVLGRVTVDHLNQIMERIATLSDKKGNYSLEETAEIFLEKKCKQLQIAEQPEPPISRPDLNIIQVLAY